MIYSPTVPKSTIRDYHAAAAFLLKGRNPTRRKVANNTYIERRGANAIAVRLHDTDVITYHADGTLTLRAGGFYTMTTRSRFDAFLPTGMATYSVKGRWYVRSGQVSGPFVEGMTIGADSELPPPDPAVAAEDAANKATRKAIDRYMTGLTAEVIADLVQKASEEGIIGDCWYCAMTAKGSGEPLGDSMSDDDHLRKHVEELYYMASLCYNAVKATGCATPGVVFPYAPLVRRAVRRYLRKRLTVGAVVVR